MSHPSRRILLVSNGHGEDLSGALLAAELQHLGQRLEALPLVGHGGPYRQAGIPVLGVTREFSTGGLGYTSLRGRLRELRQGQPLYLLGRILTLLRQRRHYDLVVAIGDLVPVLAAWLARRQALVYLVAYSSHYEGRLRLPWPCGPLLRSRLFLGLWSRDALTARDLSRQLRRPVRFLGNPFLDAVVPAVSSDPSGPSDPGSREGRPPCLGLLPGSRLPEALGNLGLMLQMLALLPEPLQQPGALRLLAAPVRSLEAGAIVALAEPLGWRAVTSTPQAGGPPPSRRAAPPGDLPAPELLLQRGSLQLELHWGCFTPVLQASDLLLSMTGTAAEQAVGLAKPVLQLCGPGPQFTSGFAEAQRRLLGPGVFCAAGAAALPDTLRATAQLAASLLARLSDAAAAADWQRDLERLAGERIGAAGGSSRMATAIMELSEAGSLR
ncbi:MAG: lipid-A-disaccharide synthase-related protein [Synechococcaceae cyanobacterium]|nr:lipid-A-disaccharide synthase-related protein [Synechococcaceae cyanobacterium]